MTRSLAALAIETGISPRELAQLDDYWIGTMIDLLEERSG